MVMEMTSDNAIVGHMYEGDAGDLRSIQRRKTCDLSTLRTLIAAWLRCTPELYISTLRTLIAAWLRCTPELSLCAFVLL